MVALLGSIARLPVVVAARRRASEPACSCSCSCSWRRVLLEPMFNRFEPLRRPSSSRARLRSLADRAGVPVREVLVADASRRTRKHNAYVSGIGSTRRVVVFDTLLDGGGAARARGRRRARARAPAAPRHCEGNDARDGERRGRSARRVAARPDAAAHSAAAARRGDCWRSRRCRSRPRSRAGSSGGPTGSRST